MTSRTRPSQPLTRLPGLATAHSHAFQRALRGRTHRVAATRSFWSWRNEMYRLSERLDPDTLYAISRLAFAELAQAGVTAVGEFHYLHHQVGGQPYDDRTTLARVVIRAARDVGLRITLLRVLYQRGGFRTDLSPPQLRFSDRQLDEALSGCGHVAPRSRGRPLCARWHRPAQRPCGFQRVGSGCEHLRTRERPAFSYPRGRAASRSGRVPC